jgi:ubiquinol-cytochrome c reductase cytochrome b subunit
LLFLVVLHLILLHKKGGRNPYFVSDNINRSYNNLYPYFILKDFIGLFMFLVIFIYLIAWDPNLLGHSDNYIMANSLVTPEHIVPE